METQHFFAQPTSVKHLYFLIVPAVSNDFTLCQRDNTGCPVPDEWQQGVLPLNYTVHCT